MGIFGDAEVEWWLCVSAGCVGIKSAHELTSIDLDDDDRDDDDDSNLAGL